MTDLVARARCAFCGIEFDPTDPQERHEHSPDEIWPDWQAEANCIGMDVAEFYPDNYMSDRQAMLACFGCKVRTECLSLALRRPERLGIWGGSTQSQRSAIRRLRASHEGSLQIALEITEDAARRRRLLPKEEVA